ncbi:MAG: DNA-protecting protein DprA [Candidatus Omnitrophica bacterium]|nr:DNA-protecting protein DprA [Candidatus Omnitrophota bacterium]
MAMNTLTHACRTLELNGSDYPELLRQSSDPPQRLYVKGDPEALRQPMIALVGSRHASDYGRLVCERLAGELAARGITVVSGLAVGIDAAAHRGALAVEGRTVAVLGHGLNFIYPRENAGLARRILDTGGAIVTEFEPGEGVQPFNFPKRNRIISGLSLGVVVVEAAKKSGSLITARLAMEDGREVFAVPGPVTSERSEGVHRLIQDGAKLVHNVDDILEEIPQLSDLRLPERKVSPEAPALVDQEAHLYSMLGDEPRHVDELIQASTLPAQDVIQGLMTLTLKKLAQELPGRRFVRSVRTAVTRDGY